MPNLSININTRRIFYCKLFSKFIPARILVCFFRKMPAELLWTNRKYDALALKVCKQNISGKLLLAPSSAQALPCKRRRGRRLEHRLLDVFALKILACDK